MNVVRFLAVATVAGQVLAVALAALLVLGLLQRRSPRSVARRLAGRVSDVALPVAALVAVTGMLGSLYLSEVMHLPPCLLCWWQRILLYPQTAVLGVGAWFRDRSATRYSLVLSLLGVGVAAYHVLLQAGAGIFTPCGGGELISCTSVQVLEFGYVTIPVMSLTAFVLVTLLSAVKLVRWNDGASDESGERRGA